MAWINTGRSAAWRGEVCFGRVRWGVGKARINLRGLAGLGRVR